jgi:hypothetical protein
MVKKINPDGSSTIYIGAVYEVDKDAEGTVTGTTTYYPAAGAMRADGTLYYVLGDQLGSASAVLDENGDMVGETRYYPYGETRSSTGSMFTDWLYTGQREVADLGRRNICTRVIFETPERASFDSGGGNTRGGKFRVQPPQL